jgi:hypothetical protein
VDIREYPRVARGSRGRSESAGAQRGRRYHKITVSSHPLRDINIAKDHIISKMNNYRFPRMSFLCRSSLKQNRTAPYSYIPLDKSAREVRLLTLLPGNLGEDIHVQLFTQILTQKFTPRYEALSYAWGTAEDPVNIYVGNSKNYVLSVSKNLACALDHLRFKETSRILWIDAICVDQQNLEERSQQVGRMADIYRLAERVMVWVGPEEDDSSLAMDILRTLGTNVEVDWSMRLMKPSKEAEMGGDTHWSDRSVILPFKSEDGIPIRNLLNRSWFERLWIRQEICLANSGAILVCGFDTIPWSDFRKAVFCLKNKRGPDGYFGEKTKFKARLQMIYRLSDKGNLPFGRLMHQTRNCKCSDPRDRVYALLSIYNHDLNIAPDYHLSKEEVYRDFCLRHIASVTYSNLDILRSCEMPISHSDLPSWVPDWSIRNVSEPIQTSFASGISAADVQYLGGGVMRAMGVKVATIVHADEIPIFDLSTNETVALIRRFAPADLDINGKVFDTYFRTLCCDQFRDSVDPPAILFPSLDKSKEALRFFLGPDGNVEPAKPLNPEIEMYANWARYFMEGRSFFSTDKGHIGLGPKVAKPEDDVVVFAGCDSPMVLRSTDNGRYRVVGECFIYDLSHSEALLGPLPEGYQQVLKTDKRWKQSRIVYYNRNTDQTHTIDPRLNLFRTELQENGVQKIYAREPEIDAQSKDEGSAIRMLMSAFKPESEVCRLMGIDIRPFDLV